MFHYIDRRGHLWQSIDRFLDGTGASLSLRLSRPMRLQTGVALHPRYDDPSWATHVLGAGKSIKWVADQLGHADPALTLRVYAHAMKEEERDLSFAEFGGSKRLYPAPGEGGHAPKSAKSLNLLARREGFEPPTLRFDAWRRSKKNQ